MVGTKDARGNKTRKVQMFMCWQQGVVMACRHLDAPHYTDERKDNTDREKQFGTEFMFSIRVFQFSGGPVNRR